MMWQKKFNRVTKYILPFIGLGFLKYFIWFRFLSERVFFFFQANPFNIIFLLFVCFIYSYLLWIIYKHKF